MSRLGAPEICVPVGPLFPCRRPGARFAGGPLRSAGGECGCQAPRSPPPPRTGGDVPSRPHIRSLARPPAARRTTIARVDVRGRPGHRNAEGPNRTPNRILGPRRLPETPAASVAFALGPHSVEICIFQRRFPRTSRTRACVPPGPRLRTHRPTRCVPRGPPGAYLQAHFAPVSARACAGCLPTSFSSLL